MAATLGLILICTVASTTSLTLIYMLAMLGIYMLIEGVLKAQYYSFISLNLILPAAATLGLTPIYIVASRASLLPICTVASTTSLTPICTVAMLGIHILLKGISKAQHCSFMSLDLIASSGSHFVVLYLCIRSFS